MAPDYLRLSGDVGFGRYLTKRKKIVLLVASVIIALIALGAFRVYHFFDYDFDSPRIAVFLSPDKSRSAYLIWHGALMGRTLSLLVSPSNSETDVRWIGSVTADDSLNFEELVWSRGGSLIAARCCIGGYNDKLPEGVWPGLFTHGYDFSAARRVVSARDVFDTPAAWMARHEQLERLLQNDDGGLAVASSNDLNAKMRNMKWLEWRGWRQRLRAAREREDHTLEGD